MPDLNTGNQRAIANQKTSSMSRTCNLPLWAILAPQTDTVLARTSTVVFIV
jgi:hypothetical protein